MVADQTERFDAYYVAQEWQTDRQRRQEGDDE